MSRDHETQLQEQTPLHAHTLTDFFSSPVELGHMNETIISVIRTNLHKASKHCHFSLV